jgi:hypothetical protein
MSENTRVKMRGQWFITLYGPDGQIKDKKQGYNVVTTVGKEFLASFLSSACAGAATFTGKYIAIGTDSTAEAIGNTALGTELTRTTGTASYISGQIYQVTATFAAGSGTGAIVEYGLFSSSTNGTLIARDTEPVVNKGASDTLTIVAQLTLS